MIKNCSISPSTSKRNLYAWILAVIVDVPKINLWNEYAEKIANAYYVSSPYNIIGYIVSSVCDTFCYTLQCELWSTQPEEQNNHLIAFRLCPPHKIDIRLCSKGGFNSESLIFSKQILYAL